MARNPIFAIIWLVLLFFLAWPIAAACAGVSRSVVSCHTAALLYYYVHSLCVRPRVCQTLARTDRHLYRPFLFPCSQFASLPYEYPPASVYQLWIILQVSLHVQGFAVWNLTRSLILTLYISFSLPLNRSTSTHACLLVAVIIISHLKHASISSRILPTSWKSLLHGLVIVDGRLVTVPLVVLHLSKVMWGRNICVL